MRAECPNCGFEVPTELKSWEHRGLHGVKMRTYTFICPKCGKRFRKTMKIGGPQTPQDQAQGTGPRPYSRKIKLKASEVERKILICLKQSSVGLTPSQIAELTGLNVASVRTYLVRLRKRGFVERKKWGWYEITSEGYKYLHELRAVE